MWLDRGRVSGRTAMVAAAALVAVAVGWNTAADRLFPAAHGSGTSAGTSQSDGVRDPLGRFHFREEDGWRPMPAKVGVVRSRDVGTAWLLDPCMPTAYPTDGERDAMTSLTRTRAEGGWFEARQLAVYPDEATAAKAMAGFRRAVAVCGSTDRTAGGGPRYSSQLPADPGDEARIFWDVYLTESREPVHGGYTVVMREGRSVYLAAVSGPFISTGPPDPGATDLIAVAKVALPLPQ